MANGSVIWSQQAAAFVSSLLVADRPTPEFLTSASGRNDPKRYDVYRNNVTVSLVRAMEANFVSLVRLLGREFFVAMAQVFVCSHPPRSRLLFEYGHEFPEFIETFEPTRQFPYLADVARLEQMWREAFHEFDVPIVTQADFAALSLDHLPSATMVAHPATRILQSKWAAGSIFSANRSDAVTDNIEWQLSEWVLVTRPHLNCEVRILSDDSGAFLSALLAGLTFEAAAIKAFEINDKFNLAENITGLIISGAFTAIEGHTK